jgi:hypothetical protein
MSAPLGSTQGTSLYNGLNLSQFPFQFAEPGMECTIQVMKDQIAEAIRKTHGGGGCFARKSLRKTRYSLF